MMERMNLQGWFAALACGLILCGCGESDNLIRRNLDIILSDDLKAITNDLPKNTVADSVYYTLISYKSYSEGMYSRMAVVDFYFMKNIKVKITRKYRYFTSARLWDRYYNTYQFFGDTAYGKRR